MLTATREKFSDTHALLKKKLLDTGDAIIQEVSPLDNYWGLGKKRLGQNKLGKILMQVRDELKVVAEAPVVAADDVMTTEQVRVDTERQELEAAQQPEAFPVAEPVVNDGPVLHIAEVDAEEVGNMLGTQEHNPRGKVTFGQEVTNGLDAEVIPEDSDVKVVTITQQPK
jgi:hypothetical protein